MYTSLVQICSLAADPTGADDSGGPVLSLEPSVSFMNTREGTVLVFREMSLKHRHKTIRHMMISETSL